MKAIYRCYYDYVVRVTTQHAARAFVLAVYVVTLAIQVILAPIKEPFAMQQLNGV